MRPAAVITVACAFSAGLVASSIVDLRAHAQEGAPAVPPDMEQAWAEYAALGKPGPQHKALDRFVGRWDVATTLTMPGMDPVTSEGAATNEWVLDGRYIMTRQSGSMMGQPFTGIGFFGFDNYKNKFVQTWCDSMTTAFAYSEGEAAPDGSAYIFHGTMDEPMMKMHDRTAKYFIRIESDDRHIFEIHDPGLELMGMPTKVVEMVYTRAK